MVTTHGCEFEVLLTALLRLTWEDSKFTRAWIGGRFLRMGIPHLRTELEFCTEQFSIVQSRLS